MESSLINNLTKTYFQLKEQANKWDQKYVTVSHYVIAVPLEVYNWLLETKDRDDLTWEQAYDLFLKQINGL